ncbi:hypothetical protein [Faunimonas pinastri]|uniref:hypothetical protein n=1 Tax=Faunimonas pinastri TaxID=1855383 RepID=UPI000B892393|nr:hypothetical protein [Faunimonas pinastri]
MSGKPGSILTHLEGRYFIDGEEGWRIAPAITESTEIVLAELAKSLPGWSWQSYMPDAQGCRVWIASARERRSSQGNGRTEPLAILSALLSALIENVETEFGYSFATQANPLPSSKPSSPKSSL